MKTLLAGLNSWKTTLIGMATAILAVMQEYDVIVLQPWVLPALIAAFAIVARDANKSDQDAGIRP